MPGGQNMFVGHARWIKYVRRACPMKIVFLSLE